MGITVMAGMAHGSVSSPKPPPPILSQATVRSLAQAVREADGVAIQHGFGKDRAVALFEDAAWRERLAVVLEGAFFETRSHCFCISIPEIQLLKNNAVVLTLTMHHGEKLRVEGGGVSSDFFVGTAPCAAISALVKEKPAMAKPLPTIPMKVPPPKVELQKDIESGK